MHYFVWKVYPECWPYSLKAAREAVRFNAPVIQVPNGMVPVVNTTIENFKQEYKVQFNYYTLKEGDIRRECMIAANKIAFEYLDKKYGEKWRSQIRKEITEMNYPRPVE